MTTAKQKETEKFTSIPVHLLLIKGGQYYATKKQQRVSDFWNFCHATLWPTENFTAAQVAVYKSLIADHFAKSTDYDKTFLELVQRAVLAKRYVRRSNHRYLPSPHTWFFIDNPTGLTGTAAWLEDVKTLRNHLPGYNEGIALLAEAVLSFLSSTNAKEVNAVREAFIEMNQKDLLFIYIYFIFQNQFINA